MEYTLHNIQKQPQRPQSINCSVHVNCPSWFRILKKIELKNPTLLDRKMKFQQLPMHDKDRYIFFMQPFVTLNFPDNQFLIVIVDVSQIFEYPNIRKQAAVFINYENKT